MLSLVLWYEAKFVTWRSDPLDYKIETSQQLTTD